MYISEDKTVLLEGMGAMASVVYISGSLGGGTAAIGYYTQGVFTPLSGASSLDTGEQYEIRHGYGMPLFIQLVGSTSPTLTVIARGIA